MKLRTILFFFLGLQGSAMVGAFVGPCNMNQNNKIGQPVVRIPSKLFVDNREEMLRKEIAERNINKDNEDKYIVVDGENFENMETAVTTMDVENDAKTAAEVSAIDEEIQGMNEAEGDITALLAKLEKLSEPRAYPLFMAEKAAELVESTWTGLAKSFLPRSSSSSMGSGNNGEKTKERVVVLGTGWGAAALVKDIDTNIYDVTVISPRNYFVFTPMLAGASVGTVEFRSITEPIRTINPKANFLEATALSVDPKSKKVSCESVICGGNSCEIEDFDVEYDRLVVTVGAQTNTFGIPGVREYCNFLKQVEDARQIRNALVNCFERASLPTLSDEERMVNLTFVIIGAGPTGIEFAAELRDFIEQDGPKYYPQLLKFVRIKVIEASATVLAPFDKSLQQEAIKQIKEAPRIKDPEIRSLLPERFELTELILESSVKEVTEKTIELSNGNVIPYGMAVWAAGNGPLPITLQLIEALGKEQADQQQYARGRIAVDPWLRALGSNGEILALGDCTVLTKGALPATGQVASQQGEYLAGLLNRRFDLSPPLLNGVFLPPVRDPATTRTTFSDSIAGFAANSYEYAKPFQFLNLGILAYTGGATALAQVTPTPDSPIKSSGKVGNFLWRSVYLSKQVSWRNRLLVLNDWARRSWFGRDITRL